MAAPLDRILDLLNAHHQRATYGAVAAVIGAPTPRSVLSGRKRDWRHSWVVNQETGLPTDYHELQRHPKLREREMVLETEDALRAWLEDPR